MSFTHVRHPTTMLTSPRHSPRSSAVHGRTALPFATYDDENVVNNQYRSPRLAKKNSKFDVGAAKVGAGGIDGASQQYEYERMQAQAAAMKARNQYGDGNIFGQ